MREFLDRAVTGVLVVATIVVAASAVRMAFFIPHRKTRDSNPVFISSWREALPIGARIGTSNPPVTVVELGDFQCPACRSFHKIVRGVLTQRSAEVSLVFVHYPLGYHEFALPAARASDCARRAGRFPEWESAMYEKQDSLGKKSWGSFAIDAGIKDTTWIKRCASDTTHVFRVEAGRAFAEKIHASATPTVIVNGWWFPEPPSTEVLNKAIDDILAGKRPRDASGAPVGGEPARAVR